MRFVQKVALAALGLVAIWIVAAIAGSAIASFNPQSTLMYAITFLYLLGCVIYLAVDAANRHQRD